MKKLVKVKLINWYTFSNTTIPIQGNTLISGQNGSGKSTLLDAIQYVLTAGTAKFNKAADDKSKRTLESYVRGKISKDGKDYLRPGDVTSYICLQLVDDDSNRKDLIGAVIEIPYGSKENHTFFKITNEEINDSLFATNGVIKTLNEFKRETKVEKFDTKSEVQSMIKSVLGLSKEKYFDLLNRALAFKPITDLNQFVNTFLLQDNPIDLENLQENINNFRELQEIIEKEEKKITELEKIEKLYENYKDLKKKENKLDWILKKLQIGKVEVEIKKKTKEKYNQEKRRNELENLIEENERKIKSLIDTIELYQKDHNSDGKFNLYIELQKRIKEIEKHLNSHKDRYKLYIKNVEKEQNLLSKFSWANINSILDEKEPEGKSYLKKYQLNLEREKSILFEKLRNYEIRKKQVIVKEKEYNARLNRLNRNQFYYEEPVINLQDSIKVELERKYNTKIEVRPLCEYLSIKEEKWTNAIEGYLNTQRFDLIIDPKYFDDALDIYESTKKTKKIHGVGLVNTNKLREIEKINDNTLANKISASNPYAKMYAIQLLNDVFCCDKVEELKRYKKSITPTCMTYRNNVARQINPHVYEDKYIGEKAKKEQLKKYQIVFQQTQQLLKEINSEIMELDKDIETLKSSQIVDLIQDIDVVYDYKKLTEELHKKEQDLKKLKEEKLLFDVITEIDKKEEERKNLEDKTRTLRDEKSRTYLLIEDLIKAINEKQEEKNHLVEKLGFGAEEWKEEVSKYNEETIEVELKDNNTKWAKLENSIEIGQKDFNENFQFDETPIIDTIEKYIGYLYRLREQEIVQYKSKSIQFKETCQRSFKEDFLVNLRHSIEKAQDEIKELNKALKENKFGKERYELVYSKSDDPELGKYYDIIVSGADYVRNTLFSDDLTEEQKDNLEILFEKILASSSEENTKKIVEEYTDYRKYMSYDIKVTDDYNDSYYFSKVAREKSGGEIQTPFYVIIAASFEQLLKSGRRNTSLGCIALFDEAFNTMDGTRIAAMMNFYKKLNIQLLIAVPSEKIANIAPYVDTNLIVEIKRYQSNVISIRNPGVINE